MKGEGRGGGGGGGCRVFFSREHICKLTEPRVFVSSEELDAESTIVRPRSVRKES